MSAKPKKRRNMEPANTPATQQYQPGQLIMARTKALNAQWVVSKVLDSSVVEFPDGSQYPMEDVQIGGMVNPMPTVAPAPSLSPLQPGYEAFKQQVLDLDKVAQAAFQMPLEMVLAMVRRQAIQAGIASSGKMDNIGGQPLFVPDAVTLGAWLESYLLEVQRREQGGSPE